MNTSWTWRDWERLEALTPAARREEKRIAYDALNALLAPWVALYGAADAVSKVEQYGTIEEWRSVEAALHRYCRVFTTIERNSLRIVTP